MLCTVMLATAMLVRLPTAESSAGAQGREGDAQGQMQLQRQGGPPGQAGPPPFQGGPQGRPPFVMGTVVEISKEDSMLLVEAPFAGERVIKVTASTKLMTQTSAKVSDLKVGDHVQVQGVPTGIAASSVSIGQPPEFLRMGAPGGGQRQGGAQAANMAFGTATGTVKALSPLTIMVNKDTTVTVKMAADAKLTKIAPITFAGIKSDDRVMAAGETDSEGIFVATGLAVNLGMGGFGMGPGFGGPPMGPGQQRLVQPGVREAFAHREVVVSSPAPVGKMRCGIRGSA